MSWTDERVAVLKKLWGEGKTAAEIATELGGVTRNAVIGKAHRLKLSNRLSPIQQSKKVKPANTSTPPVERKPKKRKVEQVIKKGKGLKLIELSGSMCRWPIGDPRDEDFGFCGCRAAAGLPYCDEHASMAYQAASRSRTLKAEDFEEKKSADDSQGQNSQKIAVSQ